MLEGLLALGALILFLAVLPRMLRRTKTAHRKSGSSGVWVGIGLAFAMVFDPKASQATELIDQKQDEREDEESGDQP